MVAGEGIGVELAGEEGRAAVGIDGGGIDGGGIEGGGIEGEGREGLEGLEGREGREGEVEAEVACGLNSVRGEVLLGLGEVGMIDESRVCGGSEVVLTSLRETGTWFKSSVMTGIRVR